MPLQSIIIAKQKYYTFSKNIFIAFFPYHETIEEIRRKTAKTRSYCMKKKTIVFAAVVLLLTLPVMMAVAGPKGQGSSETTVAGVVYLEDQFMRLLSMGYEDAAKEAGVKVLLANTGNDQAKEAELVNTYVSQGVAGLVIAPLNTDTSIPVLQRASTTMKIATCDRMLTNAPFIVGGFASDNENLGATTGAAAAEFIKNNLGGRAKIAIIQFKALLPDQSAARVKGFMDAVKKVNPNVEFVADQDAWVPDTAVQKAGDILTGNKDINLIFAANDGGTIGSVMAVKNAGLAGKCFVFGIDTGEQQIAMLRDRDNILQAVTGQDPYTQGYNAMKLLIDAINGKDYSATKGKVAIVPGQMLSRQDPAGTDAYERNLKAKLNR
jgi:simple sugar transport system substrate-binding protein/ribose transport system substrate-binding protein